MGSVSGNLEVGCRRVMGLGSPISSRERVFLGQGWFCLRTQVQRCSREYPAPLETALSMVRCNKNALTHLSLPVSLGLPFLRFLSAGKNVIIAGFFSESCTSPPREST